MSYIDELLSRVTEVRICEGEGCNNVLKDQKGKQKYQKFFCSRLCYRKPLEERECGNPACKKVFKPHTRRDQKYCTDPCYWQAKTKPTAEKECPNCEQPFKVPGWKADQIFCTRFCRYDHLQKSSRKAFTVEACV